MTQPPSYPTPPAGGPPPTAGGFAPPSGPTSEGYAVPPQYAPVPPPGWAPPPGHAGPFPRYAVPPPGYAGPPPGYAGPPPGYAGPPRPAVPPPTLSPGGQPLASFTDRLLATLIDSAVFFVVGMVLAVPALIVFFVVVMPDLLRVAPDGRVPEPDLVDDLLLPFLWMELAILAISLVVAYVYYVEMMFRTGQTFGKKSMKLRVVPLDPTRTLDRRAAVRRFAVQNVASLVLPGLSYLDGLWQLWDKPWQQCLHDKFAGTVVVKVSE
ncbi:RDD family protein [Micromonospora phytophila]|uniref:RDD family protein n=1 Tax=Micromonospora phytophila TaxID=709888 RepID=UPI00202DFCD5|nr:RDD family protein [Micromonospora phytophila]MCM0674489.1 RDD family protein [Micromonospora phytophila]